MKKQDIRVLVRNFVIELLLYSVLVVAYSIFVMRLLAEPLQQLFHNKLTLYAFVTLGLIVAQGTLLDSLTSFLLKLLPLDRLD
jgi:hypothetical protein